MLEEKVAWTTSERVSISRIGYVWIPGFFHGTYLEQTENIIFSSDIKIEHVIENRKKKRAWVSNCCCCCCWALSSFAVSNYILFSIYDGSTKNTISSIFYQERLIIGNTLTEPKISPRIERQKVRLEKPCVQSAFPTSARKKLSLAPIISKG